METTKYNSILEKVQEGFPIYKAIKKEGISSTNFYKGLTSLQKKEIISESMVSKFCHHRLHSVDLNEKEGDICQHELTYNIDDFLELNYIYE